MKGVFRSAGPGRATFTDEDGAVHELTHHPLDERVRLERELAIATAATESSEPATRARAQARVIELEALLDDSLARVT